MLSCESARVCVLPCPRSWKAGPATCIETRGATCRPKQTNVTKRASDRSRPVSSARPSTPIDRPAITPRGGREVNVQQKESLLCITHYAACVVPTFPLRPTPS